MYKKRYSLVLYELPDKAMDILITGFPGFGAVGILTTKHIVEKLKMKRIGYILPPIIPDFTSYEDFGLSLPHEVYVSVEHRLVVLLNRVNPYRNYMNSFVRSVIELIDKLRIKEAILIGGLDSRFRERDEEYRWLKTSASSRTLNAPLFVKGPFIVGPLASLLIAFEMKRVPAIAIFPYTEPEKVDHKAAAVAVKVLSKIIGVEIEVEELISYAKYVEEVEETLRHAILQEEERRSMMYM